MTLELKENTFKLKFEYVSMRKKIGTKKGHLPILRPEVMLYTNGLIEIQLY